MSVLGLFRSPGEGIGGPLGHTNDTQSASMGLILKINIFNGFLDTSGLPWRSRKTRKKLMACVLS